MPKLEKMDEGSIYARQRERQKQRENDFAELKSAVEFLKDKINAAVIAEPLSKVIVDEKGIPKGIVASTVAGTAIGEIATTTAEK